MVQDPITNTVLLEHIQGMKFALEQQIKAVELRMGKFEMRMDRIEIRVKEGFQEAREHRQALQEDLEATILLQGKQQKQIRRLARK